MRSDFPQVETCESISMCHRGVSQVVGIFVGSSVDGAMVGLNEGSDIVGVAVGSEIVGSAVGYEAVGFEVGAEKEGANEGSFVGIVSFRTVIPQFDPVVFSQLS